MVDDVAGALDFYTTHLGFKELSSALPAFADISRGNLRLLLSGPASSAGRAMPDGAQPGPGGPAVHVAMLRDETVRRRHWLDDQEFLDLFGAVSVLPGPSSTQLAIVLSKRRAGWPGLAAGGAAFIAPAMAIVLGLSWAYV